MRPGPKSKGADKPGEKLYSEADLREALDTFSPGAFLRADAAFVAVVLFIDYLTGKNTTAVTYAIQD